MYEVLEVSLADLTRLYSYKQQDLFKADFSLKGFDNPWMVCSREWKAGEKVLDVGGAYSQLPMYLHDTYGCEVWLADDYGIDSDDPYWLRNASPQEHIAKNPEIHFVLERLGRKDSQLPMAYFDVVYSVSVLEHVPYQYMPDVWHHMDRLLKPGGEMIHTVDIPFPSNGGLKKLLAAQVYDFLNPMLPQSFRLRHFLTTPRNYLRLVYGYLQVRSQVYGKGTDPVRMCLDPDVVVENVASGMKRIYRDKIKGYRYQRVASLVFRMKKI